MSTVKTGSWSETNCCRWAPDDAWWVVGNTWDHERERKETENKCRHTSWPDCLLPSHLCLCWWEDWGRRVWKSHTHSHALHQKPQCFVCFDLSVEQIEHRGVVSRLTFVLRKSHPWEPRTRAVDSATLICVCVCLSQPLLSGSPPAPSHTPSTPPSWSTYVRKREEMRQRAEDTMWE